MIEFRMAAGLIGLFGLYVGYHIMRSVSEEISLVRPHLISAEKVIIFLTFIFALFYGLSFSFSLLGLVASPLSLALNRKSRIIFLGSLFFLTLILNSDLVGNLVVSTLFFVYALVSGSLLFKLNKLRSPLAVSKLDE